MYGCGLRISECLSLRVHNFNFDMKILTIHDGKGNLLQANYDIRTIQELLGHSDIRTTMICMHTMKSVTIKDLKSPLDFKNFVSLSSGCHQPYTMAILIVLLESQCYLIPDYVRSDQGC